MYARDCTLDLVVTRSTPGYLAVMYVMKWANCSHSYALVIKFATG